MPIARAARGGMDAFILLGDSLFQRAFSQEKDATGQTIGSLGPRLSDAYLRRLDVVNRGFSGYNTRQVLSVLGSQPSMLSRTSQSARIVVIFLGANDARLPDTPGGPQQHVPLNEFSDNLRKIVHKAKEMECPKHVILITPPPVDERQTVAANGQRDPSLQGIVRRKAVVTAEYAAMVRKVGKIKNVAVLDLWSVMMERAGWKGEASSTRKGADPDELDTEYLDEHGKTITESKKADTETTVFIEPTLPGSRAAPVNHILQSYLVDGLHLTRKGYDLLFDELMHLIGEKFPDQLPERLPFVVPAWDAEGAWDEQQQLKEAKERDAKERQEIMVYAAFMAGIILTCTWFWLLS